MTTDLYPETTTFLNSRAEFYGISAKELRVLRVFECENETCENIQHEGVEGLEEGSKVKVCRPCYQKEYYELHGEKMREQNKKRYHLQKKRE